MKLRLRGRMCLSAALLVFFLAVAPRSGAQPLDREGGALDDLWTSPLSFKNSPNQLPFISASAAQSAGKLTFLVTNRDQALLMPDPSSTGPGQLIPMATRGSAQHLAAGAGDDLWIGGGTGERRSIFGAPLSEGYLAKINRKGQIFWEREYGQGAQRRIESLAALPSSNNVIVAGKHNDSTWIARIAADGRIVWEKFVGIGKGASLVVVENKIVLAAFDAAGAREDVAVWTFDHGGQLINKLTIREAINTQRPTHAGRLITRSFGGDAYVFSVWSGGFDSRDLKPLAVTRIDSSGQSAWQKELPQTVVEFRNRTTPCLEHVAVLANGDPLVACRRYDGIQLIRLDAQKGDVMESLVSPPPPLPHSHCVRGRAFLRTLSQTADMSLWLFGAQSDCMWLGRIAPSQLPTRDSRPQRGRERSQPL